MAPSAVIVGGGPAGLMAAEMLSSGAAGAIKVLLFDAMPSVGRKFLLAGKGGLNLTHAEPLEQFLARYGTGCSRLAACIRDFDPGALRAFAAGLGIPTHEGSSGRVFPDGMKAAPLLRAWLHRLRGLGVEFHVRHRWVGWDDAGNPCFLDPRGNRISVPADALVLALGGASWPRLGSDGNWTTILAARGVPITPLVPANCGFDVTWSQWLQEHFAGTPVKRVRAWTEGADAIVGEFIITTRGIEGTLVYSLSRPLREAAARNGHADLHLDLAPARTAAQIAGSLAVPRGKRTLSEHLRRRAGLDPARIALLREHMAPALLQDAGAVAATIKDLVLRLEAPRPVAEAISTAGGICLQALDQQWMIRSLPGVFCAGEMLDWEAPTGGYLLTACFATGRAAGLGARRWIQSRDSASQKASTSASVL